MSRLPSTGLGTVLRRSNPGANVRRAHAVGFLGGGGGGTNNTTNIDSLVYHLQQNKQIVEKLTSGYLMPNECLVDRCYVIEFVSQNHELIPWSIPSFW